MFESHGGEELFGASDALQAIAELEHNTNDSILAQRASERLEIRTKVLVRPANASQRHQFVVECVTADMSNGGCMVLATRPLLPGDLFWLSFDDTQIRIGSLFERCLRCRFVREEAYEVGFRFLNDIDLSSILRNSQGALL
jgi:hypothetical protein